MNQFLNSNWTCPDVDGSGLVPSGKSCYFNIKCPVGTRKPFDVTCVAGEWQNTTTVEECRPEGKFITYFEYVFLFQ